MMNIALTQRLRRFKIIVKPHLSEKSTRIADKYRQFAFKVSENTSKLEIKQAVESLFNVKVNAVQLLNVKPKPRRFKQVQGYRKAWKKAYVSLKEGYDIDFTGTK